MQKHIDQLIQLIVDRLQARPAGTGRPFLVAIDGRSGAGKSTIARRLVQPLDAALVCADDFYAGGTGVRSRAPEELAALCIDRHRMATVLAQLKAGRAAEYRPFDWERFDGRLSASPVRIRPKPVVIVEGVYTNHPDLRELIDFSVLVRVSTAERERRLLRREGTLTEWERQWHDAEDWYLHSDAKLEDFDIVIDNQ